MTTFTDNFTESSLDSNHWILNSWSYGYNPGWWTGAQDNAVYDSANNRIILRNSNTYNAIGEAALFGFDLTRGFKLEFDVNTPKELFGVQFCKQSSDVVYEFMYYQGNIDLGKRVGGDYETLFAHTTVLDIAGQISIEITNNILTVKYGENVFYSGAFTDTITDGVIFFAGSGYLPNTSSPTSISNIQLEIPLITPSGIPSNESFGTPIIFNTLQILEPSGIPSNESFGIPYLRGDGLLQHIHPITIPSAELFGIPNIEALFPADIFMENFSGDLSKWIGTDWEIVNGKLESTNNDMILADVSINNNNFTCRLEITPNAGGPRRVWFTNSDNTYISLFMEFFDDNTFLSYFIRTDEVENSDYPAYNFDGYNIPIQIIITKHDKTWTAEVNGQAIESEIDFFNDIITKIGLRSGEY